MVSFARSLLMSVKKGAGVTNYTLLFNYTPSWSSGFQQDDNRTSPVTGGLSNITSYRATSSNHTGCRDFYILPRQSQRGVAPAGLQLTISGVQADIRGLSQMAEVLPP